jgi:hypothetical protein
MEKNDPNLSDLKGKTFPQLPDFYDDVAPKVVIIS